MHLRPATWSDTAPSSPRLARGLGLETTIVTKDIGYELRCAKPIPFDIEYTRTLGYGAVRYLLKGGSGALIAITGGRITPVALEQLQDKQTGRSGSAPWMLRPSRTRSRVPT